MEPWLIHCDGAAVRERGRMGMGVHARAPDGAVHTVSRAVDDAAGRGDSNEAEARALLAALELAHALGARVLDVRCDSDVVVQHIAGARPVTVARITRVLDEVRALLATFERVAVTLVPRHKNRDADVLARAALGLGPKLPRWERPKRRR